MEDPALRPKLIKKLSTRTAEGLLYDWSFWARPSQLPPLGDDWVYWMLQAGRGSGKTRAGAEWVRAQKDRCSPIALVGSTLDDVRDIMIEGPAGILETAPPWDRPEFQPGLRRMIWPNGAIASIFSAQRPDRLRGPQHADAWCDELAAWQYPDETWSNLVFGMRLGRQPRILITTTPRPIKLMKELNADPLCRIARTSSYANRAALAPSFFTKLIQRYEGTRLGRQEIYAELLDDVPGALWTYDNIDRYRHPYNQPLPELLRIIVSIDPATTSGEDADETGILVTAKGTNGHAYVLADVSGIYLPNEWALQALKQFHNPDRPADRIVAEINNGGEMVENTIRMIDPGVPFTAVHASRGKVIRAEPVSALYEQGKVHHVGSFPALEDQMCSFTIDYDRSKDGSPDRVDALVWGISELLVEDSGATFLEAWGKWN